MFKLITTTTTPKGSSAIKTMQLAKKSTIQQILLFTGGADSMLSLQWKQTLHEPCTEQKLEYSWEKWKNHLPKII